MTFIFRNRIIFWDISKWNRGQKKWDRGSTKHIGSDWGFTKRTKFLVSVTNNQVILHDASDEFVGIWLVEASLAMRSFG